MERKFVVYLLIVSLVMTLFSPAIMAEGKKIEFMKKRIKIVPQRSAKTIVKEKQDTSTYYRDYGYFAVETQTGGGETVKINPSRITDYDIYRNGRKITVTKFLKIIGQPERARKLKKARQYDEKMSDRYGLVGVASLLYGVAALTAVSVAPEKKGAKKATVTGIGSLVLSLFAGSKSNSDTAAKYEVNFQEAAHLAEIHNQKLMNKLGLEKSGLELN